MSKRNNTDVWQNNGRHYAKLYSTIIVEWDQACLTLRHGGHKTLTTLRRMNQISDEYNLGFECHKRAGDFETVFHGQGTVWQGDSIEFNRQTGKVVEWNY